MTPPNEKTEAKTEVEAEAKKEPAAEAAELREEIEETREELGDTVEQLAQKADVKGQAQAKVDAVRENPTPVAAIGAGVAAGLLLLWLLRRR